MQIFWNSIYFYLGVIRYSLTNFIALAKATDENLTSENWEYILVWLVAAYFFFSFWRPSQIADYGGFKKDVCDKVSAEEAGYGNDHESQSTFQDNKSKD